MMSPLLYQQSDLVAFRRYPHVRYVVGIDTGAHTGIAVYDRSTNQITQAFESVFEDVPFWLVDHFDSVFVWLEQPSDGYVWHSSPNRKAADRTAINVGKVIKEAQLLARLISKAATRFDREIYVQSVLPQRGLTKLKADVVQKLTGYEGRTNEHVRDAIMLCWGR